MKNRKTAKRKTGSSKITSFPMAILAPTINIEIAKQKQANTGNPEALLCISFPLIAMFYKIYNFILTEATIKKPDLKSPSRKSKLPRINLHSTVVN
ncbi:hypothetical protein [Pseudomonas sp. BAY1663]|uniref:hypothetical protein n=1 Tax=Pseudomonas sp. BAY1663 TaxID=1439940 RepID=UPI00210A0B66|nr:hypothetical protein [Pseudomonas sp. BAY1663]